MKPLGRPVPLDDNHIDGTLSAGPPRALRQPMLVPRLRPEYFECAARAGEVWHPVPGPFLPGDAPVVVWAYGEGTVAAAWHESPEVVRHHMKQLGLADDERERGVFYVGSLTPYELGLICEQCGPNLQQDV